MAEVSLHDLSKDGVRLVTGTYGILTTAIVKAHPKTQVTDGNLEFYYRKNATTGLVSVNSIEKFWERVWIYQRFSRTVVDGAGTLYSYVRPDLGGLNFTVIIKLPLRNISQAAEPVKPLYADLNKIGIAVTPSPVPNPESATATRKTGVWAGPRNALFGSRLIPRANWDSSTIFNKTFHAVARNPVELGLVFHGVDH